MITATIDLLSEETPEEFDYLDDDNESLAVLERDEFLDDVHQGPRLYRVCTARLLAKILTIKGCSFL